MLELVGAEPFKATLTEAIFQGDGDVTAPLVYVNYGMQEDYRQLERLGVSVRGKIVIARYGQGWRGLKPKLAQEHGRTTLVVSSMLCVSGSRHSRCRSIRARPA
jgi:N-acetylated-alpha-linked acidic dipeptidase